MDTAWSIVIHLVLFGVALGYAKFLNKKEVYEWYHPDRTWMTVVGGDLLIGIALAAECYIGTLPWMALLLYGTLHVAAGLPIIHWQRRQADERRTTAAAIDQRP